METQPLNWVVEDADETQRSKILKDIDYKEERLKEDVAKLMTWLSKMPHLPQNQSVADMEYMIIGSKGIENAKKKLDSYYSFKNIHKDIFSDLDPVNLKCAEETQTYSLPRLLPNGNHVFGYGIAKPEVACFDHTTLIKKTFMAVAVSKHLGLLNSGVIVIYDTKNFTVNTLPNWSLSNFKIEMEIIQNCSPLRLKKIICVNCHPFAVKMFETLMKPLLKKKLASRVVLLEEKNSHKLKDYLPEDFIPEDFGGKAPSVAKLSQDMIEALRGRRFRETCLEEERLRSDETKRPKDHPSIYQTDMYGVDGNFRSLAID